jgi:hypothetical protein
VFTSVQVFAAETTQQNVSERLGVADTLETSDFDQLAPENGLKAFVAVEVYRQISVFDR